MADRNHAWTTVERAARDSYGRLVAALAYRWNDIAAAEDAVGDALERALIHWPEHGVPENPDAWLRTAAKNRLRERARHHNVLERTANDLLRTVEATLSISDPLPDHRLHLMFACAHPAIDAGVRTPLMLQSVLGLDAARIAESFVVAPSTMSQRLVRAKQKIRDARIPFDPPDRDQMSERVEAVLEGIYAAFSTGWNDVRGESSPTNTNDLVEEALFLGDLLRSLLPDNPETMGLVSLMMFSHARKDARFRPDGAFVPLREQDLRAWDRTMIQQADTLLLQAAAYRKPGPFQLEAAIQSAHCQRLFTGSTPWRSIATLYETLHGTSPTLATGVGFAVALVESERLGDASRILDELARSAGESYQPYWVACSHLARAQGDLAKAARCIEHAMQLTKSEPILRFLMSQLTASSRIA